jgi:hypothetical protein
MGSGNRSAPSARTREGAAAQPCLDGRPPCATALGGNTTRHHASTTWPSGRRSLVCRAMSSASSSCCSNRERSASGSAARTRSTGSGRGGPLARSATLTTPPRGPGQDPLTGVTRAPINEGRLPPREERVCLSGSRLETHQHCTPTGASCCHSLLLDPDATIGNDLHKWLFLLVTGQGEYAENFPYHGCALPTELGGKFLFYS